MYIHTYTQMEHVKKDELVKLYTNGRSGIIQLAKDEALAASSFGTEEGAESRVQTKASVQGFQHRCRDGNPRGTISSGSQRKPRTGQSWGL
jgi:hypothetical protein